LTSVSKNLFILLTVVYLSQGVNPLGHFQFSTITSTSESIFTHSIIVCLS
jgi:hypothetical protein